MTSTKGKIILKTIFLIMLLTNINRICAQEMKSTITKEEVINNAWKAMFGKLKNEDIKTIYIECNYTEGAVSGQRLSRRAFIKRPNLFRTEVSGDILIFDGNRAANIKGAPDEEGILQNTEILEHIYWKHFEIDIAIYFPAFFDYPSEFKGITKVGERDAYELHIELPLGAKVTYLVDAASFLVLKRLVNWGGTAEEYIYDHVIKGYNEYGGVLYPSGYVYPRRAGQQTVDYSKVEFNRKFNDELFKIPEG